ncbi:putative oxidoreductase [Tistlia consotensis]|uniref:Putative oxidoreductase n=1 Tax=Tistlia consotensis USBA 355 TaxID=560819 RepID=A0A1Y6C1N0_9PROT|nr:DoxX family protein [Tistlia consotensis]SMF40855.1 putative oxidoreductase [Tistlia consotensis USBA 355]SNR74365.1 putative oxidoreductase [Tistlia consotensis]
MANGNRLIIPALGGLYGALAPLADLIVRVTVGFLLIPHGSQKLFGLFGGGGLEGTAQFLASTGFTPGLFWAVLIGCTEFFGGLCLVLGLLTRPAAAAVTVFMAVAVFHHWPVWFWPQGGLEMPLLWGLMALSILIRGGGRFSLDAAIGREF